MSTLSDTFKSLAEIQYADKSDVELKETFIALANQAAALPAVPSSAAELEKINGQIQAINSINSRRAAEKERIRTAESEWAKARPRQLQEAWRNLPYSSSANGQLIAAILEDEPGLTISKIAAWCDELAAMDATDIETILNEMVKEGSLSYKHGRYYVRQICTETLILENPATTIMKQITQSCPYWYINRENTLILAILQVLEKERSALSAATIEKNIRIADKPSSTRIERLCDEMCNDEYLVKTIQLDKTLYFFNTLGLEQYEKPTAGKAFTEETTAQYYVPDTNAAPIRYRPSARQIENDKLKDCIIEKMIEQKQLGNTRFSVYEILDLLADNELASKITVQRCCALVSMLVDEERVERSVDNKVAYFSLK